MTKIKLPDLRILFGITILNYCAQIPYYFHNYYDPYHVAPRLSAVGLLGMTFLWFLIGYVGFRRKWRHGYGILLGFLLVEALFYLMTFLTGADWVQFHNHGNLIKFASIIGYVSSFPAGWYAGPLMKWHKRMRESATDQRRA